MDIRQFARTLSANLGLNRARPPVPPGAGVYHYLREAGASKTRLHLRVEADGHGMLLVNASRAYHFNPTATYMAHLFLEGYSEDQSLRGLTHFYNVPSDAARSDLAAFNIQLKDLINPEGPCPVCDLELETVAPFSMQPSAPYRMDLAITYRCNNDCAHCYNARPRKQPELAAEKWKEILNQLWEIGIPHVVFTGGEPTLRSDLPELVAHAQSLGMIAGLNTNGRLLKDPALVSALVDAGLDHVQITLESHDPIIHDQMVRRPGAWQDTVAGIRQALTSNLFVMTNTTMLQNNSPFMEDTLNFLGDLGVPTIGLNALIYSGSGANVGTGLPESSLPGLLDMATRLTRQRGQRLIWYTPTQYCHFDPIQLELGVKGCTAALYNMCIEPDGSVIPCQSYYHSLGNFLETSWEKIWNHDLSVSLRTRKDVLPACTSCALLPECGGGCPLARLNCESSIPVPVHPLQTRGMER
jgi:radical SAM protein with 4Fe4S-binding SPASM domain